MVTPTFRVSVVVCAYTERRWDDLVSAVDAPRCGESTSSPGASGTKHSDPHYRRWAHSHLGCGRAGGTPSASVDALSALKVQVENSVGLRPTLAVKVRASGPH